MADIQHSNFPDAANITACKAWFSSANNQDFSMYNELKVNSSTGWRDLQQEILHVLDLKDTNLLLQQTRQVCERLNSENRLKRGDGKVDEETEIPAVIAEVYNELYAASTVAWKEEMGDWLRAAVKCLAPKIVSNWKKTTTNNKSKEMKRLRDDTTEPGTPKKRISKQVVPGSQSPGNRSNSNMSLLISTTSPTSSHTSQPANIRPARRHQTPQHPASPIDESLATEQLPRGQKRSRPPQQTLAPRKIVKTSVGMAGSDLEGMMAGLEAVQLTPTQQIELVHQHVALRDHRTPNVRTIFLVTLTAIVEEKYRAFKSIDIRTEHLSFEVFKGLVCEKHVNIDWGRDIVFGDGIRVEDQQSFEDAIALMSVPLQRNNSLKDMVFEVRAREAVADEDNTENRC
ncbi:hypothetical protein V8E51_003057 [Hyaloscypha variabilis]